MSTKKHKKAGKRQQKNMRKTKQRGGFFGVFGKTTPVPPPDLAQKQLEIIKALVNKSMELGDLDKLLVMIKNGKIPSNNVPEPNKNKEEQENALMGDKNDSKVPTVPISDDVKKLQVTDSVKI